MPPIYHGQEIEMFVAFQRVTKQFQSGLNVVNRVSNRWSRKFAPKSTLVDCNRARIVAWTQKRNFRPAKNLKFLSFFCSRSFSLSDDSRHIEKFSEDNDQCSSEKYLLFKFVPTELVQVDMLWSSAILTPNTITDPIIIPTGTQLNVL